MIAVPTTAKLCPTVPTYVGTQKAKEYRGFNPSVPTVPTYKEYIIRGSNRGWVRSLPAKKFGKQVGTAERCLKPAQISRFCVPYYDLPFLPLRGTSA